jgi:RNA polymerase sigma-70 factor (ECF subfamily)
VTADPSPIAKPTKPGEPPRAMEPVSPLPASSTSDDKSLVIAAQRGDRAAFAQIIERYQGSVFGYLRTRVLQASDAEDLTQEVFLRCYSCWIHFDTDSMVLPWLLGIARNLLREHARRLKRRKEVAWTELCLELDEMVSSDDHVYGDMLEHLPVCFDSLGESARQALELRYSAHLRLVEIGEKLHRSEGAAKLLMFRARQALKNCLDRKFKVDDHER